MLWKIPAVVMNLRVLHEKIWSPHLSSRHQYLGDIVKITGVPGQKFIPPRLEIKKGNKESLVRQQVLVSDERISYFWIGNAVGCLRNHQL